MITAVTDAQIQLLAFHLLPEASPVTRDMYDVSLTTSESNAIAAGNPKPMLESRSQSVRELRASSYFSYRSTLA